MQLLYACVMVFNCDVAVSQTGVPYLYLKYRSSTWLKYFKKYSVSGSTIGVENANICKYDKEPII